MSEAAQHGRRPWRATGTVLLAAGVTVLGGPALLPAHAAAPESSSSKQQLSVTINTVSPAAPKASGTVTLSGSVTNSGSGSVHDLHLGLRTTGVRMMTRTEIADTADRGARSTADGLELNSPRQQVGSLAAGASATFSLKVPVKDLHLSSDEGVFALTVDAEGTTASASYLHSLGTARTFLPVYPSKGSAKPTQIATLWPVVAAPKVQAQTYTDQGAEQPVLTDDQLATDLGPEGRLGQLTALGGAYTSTLHLTWMVDPDLVNTVVAMTGKYQVVTGNDDEGATPDCKCTQSGKGSQTAQNWFTGLQSTLQKQKVVALPYGDPDLASLAHSSSSAKPLTALLSASQELGLERLQVTANHTVAWPYKGYLDTSILSLAKSMGDRTVVVNGDSMSDAQNLDYTPNAARSVGDGVTALVGDATLAGIFSGQLNTPAQKTAATQRFLAETLQITEEKPNRQRTILLETPRNVSAATAETLLKALQQAVSGKWAKAVDLSTAASATPDPGVNTKVPSVSGYPASVKKSELPSLPDVLAVQQNIANLSKVLTEPARLRAPFNTAILRSVSTQWRAQSGSGAYLASMNAYLNNELDAVHILPKPGDTVTLPGGNSSGTVGVSVTNNLQQKVTGLELRLVSESPTRLHLDKPENAVVSGISIDGGGTKRTFRFPVKAKANGPAVMIAQLYTADGKPFGTPYEFRVKVTSVSTGVTLLLAGGAFLVLLAGLRLYWKRKKNAAQQSPEDDADPSTPEGAEEHPAGDGSDNGSDQETTV